jgi:hypothetical protein
MDDSLAKKFDSIFWHTVTVTLFSLILNVANWIMGVSQSLPQMFLMVFQVGLNMTVWSVPKGLKKYKHTSKIIVFLYSAELCLYVNLAMRNIMPPGITVDMTNLEFFNGQDLIGFIFMNCMLFHDVKWLVFLNGPVFLVGSYFAVI